MPGPAPRSPALLALALATLLAPAAAVAETRLAVLEFTGATAGAELLRAVTERARGAALGPARERGLTVMTREAVALVLKEMGGRCEEGECEIEAARNVGAALVMTGEVRQLGGSWFLDLKLHDTSTGALLSAESVGPTTELGLLELAPDAARRLLAPAPAAPREVGLWYGEVRAQLGGTIGLETRGVNPCIDSLTTTLCAAPWGSARVGRRLGRGLSAEAALGYAGFARSQNDGYLDLSGASLGAATAWSPAGWPWLAVGAEVGAWRAALRVRAPPVSGGDSQDVTRTSLRAYGTAELRLDLPSRSAWSLGLRAGATWFTGGTGATLSGRDFFGAPVTIGASGKPFGFIHAGLALRRML